jgi:hypothetical protein
MTCKEAEDEFAEAVESTNSPAAKRIEQLERELTEAKAEIERLDWSGIHSCHPECQRPMCKLRRELAEAIETAHVNERSSHRFARELAEARAQRDKLAGLAGELIAMIRINVMRGTFAACTTEQIEEHLKPWIARLAASSTDH